MERYIKALYITSIIAIVAFLGMQAYWLYSRYEYSVREYEDSLLPQISGILEEYNLWRDKKSAAPGKQIRYVSNFNMDKKADDAGNVVRTIKVTALRYEPWKLLGYPTPRDLTPEEYTKSAAIASRNNADVDSIVVSADADDAPSESALWAAGTAIALDFNHPFSRSDFDSLLRRECITTDVSLVRTDSVIWSPVMKRHQSVLNPQVSVTLPYSVLEKKSVEVSCRVPVWDIPGKMLWTLTIASVISVLLIACLIWQFKIIFRLNRIDKMRNSFITTMIHELKRPVSTLKMCVSGLKNKKMVNDVEVREELLANTKDALDLLSAYFSKMRDIVFNDRSQMPLNCKKTDLLRLVDEAWNHVVCPAGKHAEFVVNVNDCAELFADPSHISNMFLNLYENAVKYSGTSVRIETCFRREPDGSVTISVKDNGNGIPSGDIGKVFSRFYRGEAAGTDIPGIGLGLTYVKLLVEAHGGRISVESHCDGSDKGTCFVINFPQYERDKDIARR